MSVDLELLAAVRDVWALPFPGPNDLFRSPQFLRLVEVLAPSGGVAGRPAFAVWHALRNLGVPLAFPPGHGIESVGPEAAAAALADGLLRPTTIRRHLCPLDLADGLPPTTFGTAHILNPSVQKLRRLFDAERLRRNYPHHPLDAVRLARFTWMVVEEEVEVDPRPEARAVPVLFMNMSGDFGAIDPHLGRFPIAVETALFFLLLLPWEDWQRMHEVDWRAFRVPWVYTLDEDLVIAPAKPPSADTLTMTYVTHGDDEFEVPETLNLDLPSELSAPVVPCKWPATQHALGSPLFQTPVRHFLVHAFLSTGIDEVMAHMMAVEAAVGTEADYKRHLRLPADKHSHKAPRRIAARIAALLQETAPAHDYLKLFELRSAFIHGRAMPTTISTADRLRARRIARKVCAALVDLAATSTQTREQTLLDLLDAGAVLVH